MTEEHVIRALEVLVGHRLLSRTPLTEEFVFQKLRSEIVGRDAILKQIAKKFVAGLANWGEIPGPRGIYFFGGPTGVGKTEVALILSRILGDGQQSAIRVDCNTLQGSGSGSDANVLRWKLFGVQAGYVGHVRGEAGLLGRIRDFPESIVIFDEFEKADPLIGQFLLRILTEGQEEDSDGNLLDFRRAFIIFTSNAGCVYDVRASVGFNAILQDAPNRPFVEMDAIRQDLQAAGHGPEFLARIRDWFLFQSLDNDQIVQVIGQQLDRLQKSIAERGFEFHWAEDLVPYLAAQWQPRFGVRHLTTMLKNRLIEQLSVADAQGELRGVTRIQLERLDQPEAAGSSLPTGVAVRERKDQTLIVRLA